MVCEVAVIFEHQSVLSAFSESKWTSVKSFLRSNIHKNGMDGGITRENTAAEKRHKNHRDIEFNATRIITWPFYVAGDFYPLQITDMADLFGAKVTDELERRLISNTLTLFVGTSWCQPEQRLSYRVWWVFFLYLTSLWPPQRFRWQLWKVS